MLSDAEAMPFAEHGFWQTFLKDLAQARARVMIQSPFLAATRIQSVSRTITRLVNSGVTICVYVQQPERWGEDQVNDPAVLYEHSQMRTNMELLRGMGVHATLRTDAHEKLAVIDEALFWDGSLNIFSHRKTHERMTRWTVKRRILQAIAQHRLNECPVCAANYMQYGVPGSSQRHGLGNRLAEHRMRLGLSQRELARRVEISQGCISHIESGDRNITLGTFVGIARELELEPVLVPRLLVPSVIGLLKRFWRSG